MTSFNPADKGRHKKLILTWSITFLVLFPLLITLGLAPAVRNALRLALCAVPGTLYLLAACQREGAVHCYYCSPLPRRAPSETASLALPGASCALVLD